MTEKIEVSEYDIIVRAFSNMVEKEMFNDILPMLCTLFGSYASYLEAIGAELDGEPATFKTVLDNFVETLEETQEEVAPLMEFLKKALPPREEN